MGVGRQRKALIQYNSPDLIIGGLKKMAAVDYSGGSPPGNLQQVSSYWYTPGQTILDRYEQLGVVKYAIGAAIPANLPVLAAMEPDPVRDSIGGIQLLPNQGFESFTGTEDDGTSDTITGWTNTGVNDVAGNKVEATATAASGTYAIKLTRTTAATTCQKTVSVQPGASYRLQFQTRGDGTVAGRYRIFDVTNNAEIFATATTGVTGIAYTAVTNDFTVAPTCSQIRIELVAPASAGVGFFDDVSLVGPEP